MKFHDDSADTDRRSWGELGPFKALGTVDDNDTCDCCGKTNLKKTVVLRDVDGEIHFFGSSCAARATGWSAPEIRKTAIVANEQRIKDTFWAPYYAELHALGDEGIRRVMVEHKSLGTPQMAANFIDRGFRRAPVELVRSGA